MKLRIRSQQSTPGKNHLHEFLEQAKLVHGENVKRVVAPGWLQGLTGKGQKETSYRDDNVLYLAMDLYYSCVCISQISWIIELILAHLYLGGIKES